MKQHKKATAIILSIALLLSMAIPTLAVSAADSETTDGKRILGDADLDGSVTILDATRIQRYLADFPDPYHIGDTAAK